jgi:F0F1-type ATP synthase assembly protein I
MSSQNTDKQALYSAYGIVSELGFLIAGPIVLLGFGGAYLDKYMGTSPLFLLSGFVLSFVASGMGVWRMIQRLNADQEARDRKEKSGGEPPKT